MELADFTGTTTNPLFILLWCIVLILMAVTGIYFTYKTKFGQITKIKDNLKVCFAKAYKNTDSKNISSFEAFCITMGARIGVGNIAGVATAIVTGGPGSIFWMWIFAIIGAATSFVESTLGQIYKQKSVNDTFVGGPAYYIEKGLRNRKLGIAFAILTIITAGIGFNCVQASFVTSAICNVADFQFNNIVIGFGVTCVAGLIIFGGMKRLAKFSSVVVPYMAIGWFALALLTICFNFQNIGLAFASIFKYMFSCEAISGAVLGEIILIGGRRAVFSNESGIGTMSSVVASAHSEHPIKQGKVQSISVLLDTFFVCTLTALAILCYGPIESILELNVSGSQLVQNIIASTPIGEVAKYLVAIFLCFFAFTSVISNYAICQSNILYIKNKKKSIFVLRIIMVTIIFLSCLFDTTSVLFASDVFMGVMTLVNVAVITVLSPLVWEAYRDYREQRKRGIDTPVFNKKVLSNTDGVTEWNDPPDGMVAN